MKLKVHEHQKNNKKVVSKKVYLILFLVFCMSHSFAQIGIGTTTPEAQLDIKSSNQATPANTDGILVPKIDTFPATNPTAAQQSMLVYLTTAVGLQQPGFYYWNNATTSWIPMTNDKGWGLTGNAGTNPATNFIGTTDNNDVVFKRNNILAGRIGNTNTSFGLNTLAVNTTGLYNSAFGNASLLLNTTGDYNSAFGNGTLFKNTTGSFNAAYGSSLSFNTTGSFNTGNGSGALLLNTTGSFNSAFGEESLLNNLTGDSNIAFGSASLINNTTGSNNSAFGIGSLDQIITGSNNIGIGFNAQVPNPAGNYQMSIANVIYGKNMFPTNTAKIGIGTSNPTSTLNVNGQVTIDQKNFGGYGGLLIKGDAPGNNYPNITFSILNTNGDDKVAGYIGGNINNNTAGSEAMDLSFQTSTNGLFGLSEKMRIKDNGNIGIGTSNPTEKLDINGKIKITDGNQALGKILTSDSSGVGTWQTPNTSNSWSTTGNAGTNPATNFIGTTDNNDVVFRRNGYEGGRIGSSNTSFGTGTLLVITTGIENTTNGSYSLLSNSTGSFNTANGSASLSSNTTGSGNTAIGHAALNINTTGLKNSAIGRKALDLITTGSNNIGVGFNAQVPNPAGDNQVRMGDTFITYAGIQVAWSITSDQRWKTNIKKSALGLDFINKLNPVSYTRTNDDKKKTEYGFIAQELEKTLNDTGDTNNGMITKDDKGMLSVRYNDLLAPMVKAIQEQQLLIEKLTKRIEELEKK
jgi:trimeric autotransporter adhesin